MPKFAFTGEVPMIFADLSYGPGVVVAGVELTADPPEGSTVVLYPGDLLSIDFEYGEHAYLERDITGEPLTVAELKAALTDLGIEIPAKAKKAELEALLADHIPTITDDGTIPPEATSSGDAAATAATSSTSPEE